jgi:hypothetical protein
MRYDHFSMLPERAFQKRPFGSMTLEGGKSAPPPDYGPLAQSSRESAEIMAGLGREQLAFARQQYGEMAPLARRVSESMISAQDEQTRQARDYYEDYRTTFRPVEQGLVRDVQEFNTEAFREQLARQAAAEAGRAFGVTQQASERAMASMGVNPASGRFAGIQAQNQLGLAASRAGAMTGARERAEQVGYARRLDVAGLGRGLPGLSTAAYSGATGAGGAGINTAMAPGNQYMAGMGQGISTIGAGRGMLQSGLGNILGNQANLYGQSMQTRGEIFGSIIGAGGRMLAASPIITSDIRLKTNIVPVGVDARTKLPIYEFAYKAAPTLRYRGVMAQDVEKLYPQAISEDASGYKRVCYGMLGMSMERV